MVFVKGECGGLGIKEELIEKQDPLSSANGNIGNKNK